MPNWGFFLGGGLVWAWRGGLFGRLGGGLLSFGLWCIPIGLISGAIKGIGFLMFGPGGGDILADNYIGPFLGVLIVAIVILFLIPLNTECNTLFELLFKRAPKYDTAKYAEVIAFIGRTSEERDPVKVAKSDMAIFLAGEFKLPVRKVAADIVAKTPKR